METIYFRTLTTVSFINYHLLYSPKYRQKIFLIPHLEERFKELIRLKRKKTRGLLAMIKTCRFKLYAAKRTRSCVCRSMLRVLPISIALPSINGTGVQIVNR